MQFENIQFQQSTTPCFWIDDFLTDDEIGLMEKNWPRVEDCTDVYATPGSHEMTLAILDQFQEDAFAGDRHQLRKREFWRAFSTAKLPFILDNTLDQFRPFLSEKYSDAHLSDYVVNSMSLRTVADGAYGGLPSHVHYYHDPLWLFSIFIYLDDDPRGLNMYKFDVDENASVEERVAKNAHFVSPFFEADRRTALTADMTIPFVRNRFVAFINSPISWHGVTPPSDHTPAREQQFGRRHFIAHAMLPREYIKDYYPVTEADWGEFYLNKDVPNMMELMKRDVIAGYMPYFKDIGNTRP